MQLKESYSKCKENSRQKNDEVSHCGEGQQQERQIFLLCTVIFSIEVQDVFR